MIFVDKKVQDVRDSLKYLLENEVFVIDKTGVKTIELIGATFIADEEAIFGTVNHDYVARELEWYKSMSLNVNDIPGGPPQIWQMVSSANNEINSNYGWCIFSEENGYQYNNVVCELAVNPYSRRAQMIYTRPSMHRDYNRDGMSDFMCTAYTQHFIREGELVTKVAMRSNDAWAGYRNDFHWQKYVHEKLATDLGVDSGPIIWNAESLHIYERQFYLVDYYAKTGNNHISKDEYRKLYPSNKYTK